MVPELISIYEVGEVQLKVYQLTNPLRNKYWLVAGVAGMEFSEETFQQLQDLLQGYKEEGEELFGPPEGAIPITRSRFAEWFSRKSKQ
jgi:hypothetical protein